MPAQVTTTPILLTTAEVAVIFGVKPDTIRNWVDKSKLWVAKTPGGQYRFRDFDVLALNQVRVRAQGRLPQKK